jgi:DNA repair ATPase RecN
MAPLLVSLLPTLALAQEDPDTREVLAYRLTMPKLRQLNDVLIDYKARKEADPAYQQLLQKKKELEALYEKDELTEADERRVERLEAEIQEAEEAEALDTEDESLAAMAARLDSDRHAAAALKRAGLSAREAATMQLAFLQAAVTAELLEAGAIKQIPPEVNAENVRFYQTHKAEIAALTALRSQENQSPGT